MTYVIVQPYVDVKDRAYVDERPVDCIYEDARSPYTHPEECVDCGAYKSMCPTGVVFYEDDLFSEWSNYLRANVDSFNDLGNPSGAQKTDVQDFGDPMIAVLPSQNGERKAENL